MNSLQALQERVRAATGRDRTLDTAIEEHFFGDAPKIEGWGGVLDYTGSTDAALALVEKLLPKGLWQIAQECSSDTRHWYEARIWLNRQNARARSGRGDLAALAILDALLSALQAKDSTDV